MQAFSRPKGPQLPQAPPPPPNQAVVEQSRQEGKQAAREAYSRASTILTKKTEDELAPGVLNKKAPSLT